MIFGVGHTKGGLKKGYSSEYEFCQGACRVYLQVSPAGLEYKGSTSATIGEGDLCISGAQLLL